jgi:hypothetical protein
MSDMVSLPFSFRSRLFTARLALYDKATYRERHSNRGIYGISRKRKKAVENLGLEI